MIIQLFTFLLLLQPCAALHDEGTVVFCLFAVVIGITISGCVVCGVRDVRNNCEFPIQDTSTNQSTSIREVFEGPTRDAEFSINGRETPDTLSSKRIKQLSGEDQSPDRTEVTTASDFSLLKSSDSQSPTQSSIRQRGDVVSAQKDVSIRIAFEEREESSSRKRKSSEEQNFSTPKQNFFAKKFSKKRKHGPVHEEISKRSLLRSGESISPPAPEKDSFDELFERKSPPQNTDQCNSPPPSDFDDLSEPTICLNCSDHVPKVICDACRQIWLRIQDEKIEDSPLFSPLPPPSDPYKARIPGLVYRNRNYAPNTKLLPCIQCTSGTTRVLKECTHCSRDPYVIEVSPQKRRPSGIFNQFSSTPKASSSAGRKTNSYIDKRASISPELRKTDTDLKLSVKRSPMKKTKPANRKVSHQRTPNKENPLKSLFTGAHRPQPYSKSTDETCRGHYDLLSMKHDQDKNTEQTPEEASSSRGKGKGKGKSSSKKRPASNVDSPENLNNPHGNDSVRISTIDTSSRSTPGRESDVSSGYASHVQTSSSSSRRDSSDVTTKSGDFPSQGADAAHYLILPVLESPEGTLSEDSISDAYISARETLTPSPSEELTEDSPLYEHDLV